MTVPTLYAMECVSFHAFSTFRSSCTCFEVRRVSGRVKSFANSDLVEEVVWLPRLEFPRVEEWPAEFVDVVAVVAREDASETIYGGVRMKLTTEHLTQEINEK
jgi:hypothetical protein